MESEEYDVQAALAEAQAAEARGAQLATSVWWYAPCYGISTAATPVGLGLTAAHVWAGIALIAVGLVSLALLVTTFRRVAGVSPTNQDTVLDLVPALIAMGVFMMAAYFIGLTLGVSWWLAVVGVLCAVTMAVLSRLYDISYARRHGA